MDRSKSEWDKLAKWVIDNKLFSDNVRWLIQIPRLYDAYKKTGLMENYQQLLQSESLLLCLLRVSRCAREGLIGGAFGGDRVLQTSSSLFSR